MCVSMSEFMTLGTDLKELFIIFTISAMKGFKKEKSRQKNWLQ